MNELLNLPHVTTINQVVAGIVITGLFIGLAYEAIEGWF